MDSPLLAAPGEGLLPPALEAGGAAPGTGGAAEGGVLGEVVRLMAGRAEG